MRQITWFIALGSVCGCSANAPSQTASPMMVDAAEKEHCRSLGVITELAGGRGAQSFNEQKVMDAARKSVTAAGGNAYYVIDLDDRGYGTQVVLEALDCK